MFRCCYIKVVTFWFFGFNDLIENLHGNICEDKLLILNKKNVDVFSAHI